MRIVFLVRQFPSLSDTRVLDQALSLIERGHEVDVVSFRPGLWKTTHADVRKSGLHHRVSSFNVPRNWLIRALKSLWLLYLNLDEIHRFFKALNVFRYGKDALAGNLFYAAIGFPRKNIDVLYCHTAQMGRIGAFVQDCFFVQKIVTLIYEDEITRRLVSPGQARALAQRQDLLLTDTERALWTLLRWEADPQKIKPLPCGVKLPLFMKDRRPKVVTGRTTLNIVMISRLAKEVDFGPVLRALAQLRRQHQRVEFHCEIIGDGELREDWEILTKALGLAAAVHFAGEKSREDVVEYLAAADLFIAPAKPVTSGITILEAQAAGIPALVPDSPGGRLLIRDRENGLLYSPKDVKTLVGQIYFLIMNPQDAARIAAEGRRSVERNHVFGQLNKKLEEALQGLFR
ncbi:MAG: glycosyltransferase [Candidatus Omnitrophica bacterium]|nr:glycosyltransferase [Candidatus Omnitrophota bacterium]